MSGSESALIETLTAQVHVLMVGARQVTLGVYDQLDIVPADDIRPLGRVSPRNAWGGEVHVVGIDADGNLVRSWLPRWAQPVGEVEIKFRYTNRSEGRFLDVLLIEDGGGVTLADSVRAPLWIQGREDAMRVLADAWGDLILLILAGLR